MPEPIFEEKSYGGPNNVNIEVRDGAATVNLAHLIKFAQENNIAPEYVDITPECDHYAGPEGPDKYLWVSWPKDKVTR